MLYLFDKDENLIHELSSTQLSSIHQTEELNKLMVIEFGVYLKYIDWMDGIEYVAHRDFENPERIQMYRILTSDPDSNCMNYQAIHILFDELKSYGYIRDKRPNGAKASAVLSEVLSGTRWKVGKVDDSDLLSASFYDCTRLEALSKILTTWQMDLDFHLTFNGSRITGRYIDLYKQRGEDTGERFVYGSNALEVVKELDKSEVYTRIIPRGKGEEKLDENGKPTDGHGRRIKIDDVVWAKAKGDPIDKPIGQEFIESVEMTKKFGFSDGEPRTKVQIFEDIENPEDLIKAGYNFLVRASRPLVQFKTKVYKKSRTNVGDIVRVIRKDLDIYYSTRIYKVDRNLLTGNVEVEFGDKLVISPAERDKRLSEPLGTLQDRIIETETNIRTSLVDTVTDEISSKVSSGDVISEINKSPEQIKIQASRIDLTGNVSVEGDFKTSPSSNSSYIHMFGNKARWYDDSLSTTILGEINVTAPVNTDTGFTFNFGHYPTGKSIVSYYSNDTEMWHPYVTFDRWNYTGDGGEAHSIIMNEGVRFKGESKFENIIHFKKMRLKEYDNGIALEDYSSNGIFVMENGVVYVKKDGSLYEVATK